MRLVGSAEQVREGWLGFHGQQIKCWRDISASGGLLLRTVGSKHQAGLPSVQHQSKKGIQITSSCEKQQSFCLPWRDGCRHREPHKEPKHEVLFATTYPGIWQSKAEWTREAWAKSGVDGSREKTEGPPVKTLCWVIPHTAKVIPLRQSIPLQVASAWGEAIAPHTGITVANFWSISQLLLQLGAV